MLKGGTPPLTEKEVTEYKKLISSDWKIDENNKLSREFFFVSYPQTIDFVNKVAVVAEKEGHHPVLHIYFGRAVAELWTHSINGLSENDSFWLPKSINCKFGQISSLLVTCTLNQNRSF